MALKQFDLVKEYIKDKDELILRNLINISATFTEAFTFELIFEFKVIYILYFIFIFCMFG